MFSQISPEETFLSSVTILYADEKEMAIFCIKFTVSLSYNAVRFWCIGTADEKKMKKKSLTLQKQNKILRPSPYSKLCREHKTSSVFPDKQYQ